MLRESEICPPPGSRAKVLLLDLGGTSHEHRGLETVSELSRRDALRLGMLATGALVLPPFVADSKANPVLPWLYWTGRVAFAGAVAWLVGRVLDRYIPDEPTRLGVKEVKARPTRDAFHNSHADPYVVEKPQYNFSPRLSREYNYYMELPDYVRSDAEASIPKHKDLNVCEIKRIAREEPNYGTVLFPCGRRCPPGRNDRSDFTQTASLYGVAPASLELDYVRPFNNGHKTFKAFGVTNPKTGDKDLLISV